MEEKTAKNKKETASGEMVNPLRNERVYVRFIPHKDNGLPKDHVLAGAKADGAYDSFVVPVLRSTGRYKNILTNDEKDYLEKALGLDNGALSVYKAENNYWENYQVRIQNAKEGMYLNLSDPEDYIKYKVLLANSDFIAPSVQERIDRPKATYRYEIVRTVEETSLASAKVDARKASYKEFDKIDGDFDTMRVLVEMMDGRPYASNTSIEFFRNRIDSLIQEDPKAFLREVTDQYLHSKVLLRRGTELGVINKRGDYYFLKDNTPLCESGENPTLSIAARYINLPSHQDVKFLLESEIGKKKGK